MAADLLATPSDLASLLKRPLDEYDTATATLVLEACTAVVQGVAEQRIVLVEDDEAVIDLDHLDCGLYLALPERPVVSVAAVSVGATVVTDFTAQLSRGRLWRAYGWRSATLQYWNAPSTVTVTYTHGIAPDDQRIQLARGTVLSFAAPLFENAAGAVSEQIDDYAVRYAEASAGASARMAASPALRDLLRRRYGRSSGSVRLVAAR